MSVKKSKKFSKAILIFVFMMVVIAFMQNSYLFATIAIVTGMLFVVLVRSKNKAQIDEREKTIREKAAQMTYAIFAPTIGIGAFLMLFPSRSGLSVFSKGEFAYLESLGMIFAYLALFLIILYSISYYFFSRKFGGDGNEE